MKILRRALWLFFFLVVFPIFVGTFFLGKAAPRHDRPEPVPGAAGVFRVRNLLVDFYAARAGDGVVLFDAGLDPTGRALDALLAAAAADRRQVRAVFLSHGHPDHVAAVALLGGAAVHAGAGDAALMRGQGGKGMRVAGLMRSLFHIPAVSATDFLDARAEVALPDGEKVLVLPFPGHTAGSMIQLFRGVLFAGDAFNYERGTLVLPPGGFTEDPAAARRSIAGLLALLRGLPVTTICTGHGGCTPPERTAALLADLVRRAGG